MSCVCTELTQVEGIDVWQLIGLDSFTNLPHGVQEL